MNIQNHPSFTDDLRASDRAAAQWERIQEKPTSIVIVRGTATTLAAQTVRIELSSTVSGSQVTGDGGGASGSQDGYVFGIHGHATLPDTDIQRDDRFVSDGVQYRVITVVKTIGQIQASIEAQT